MHVTSLHVYPVKSTAPVDVTEAEVEPWGLAGDRRWLVVDPDGVQMTARERRRLLTVSATGLGEHLTLTRPDAAALSIDATTLTARTTAEVWKTRFPVLDAGDDAAQWFSDLLDEPARLVRMDDPSARPITDEPLAQEQDRVSAADAFPLLLASSASLAQLNDWIVEDHPDDAPAQPLPMRRFRPNVVIDGDVAFAEDNWSAVRIGDVTFRGGGSCARCVLTTIDPWTLAGGKEPIRTLARRHGWDRKTWFGLNLVAQSPGSIAVGDEVEILSQP